MVKLLDRNSVQYNNSKKCYTNVNTGESYPYPGLTRIKKIVNKNKDKSELEIRKQSGIDFHNYLLGEVESDQYSPELNKLIKSYETLKPNLEIISQEVFIMDNFKDQLGYDFNMIGFIDAIAIYKGQLTLIDWKTKKSSKFDKRKLEDGFIQISLYYRMYYRTYKELPDNLGLFTIFESGEPARFFPLEKPLINSYLNAFYSDLKRTNLKIYF